ncbi:hypothetical protein GJ496_007710 [Pomphorhynchus laevis]|nr:hypothetical protein GJ496_007710 [Pomphorhynchus laevis]
MTFFTGGAKDVMRAMTLMKRRQQEHERIEEKKRKIEEENKMRAIDDKFKSHSDTVEENILKSDTIGLVTLEDMKKKQQIIAKSIENDVKSNIEKSSYNCRTVNDKRLKITRLSFADEFEIEKMSDDLQNTGDTKKKKRFGKNPDVDTSFLPDRDREEAERILREKLKQEWIKRQEEIKAEEFEIMFSFWDGSGHPRSITMKKGGTVQQFLYKALEYLRSENCFIELKCASVDQMMYVKDDVILPHHHTFYELITTRARGKHGHLLFGTGSESQDKCLNELVLRKTCEGSLDKIVETHAGKVLLRSWYERNKHIFPACRWEPFDPERKPFNYTDNI